MSGPFKELGLKLVENGYAVIPIPRGTKGPTEKGWERNYATTEAAWQKMVSEGNPSDGVGIITKFNPGVDIDCRDEDVVEHMIEWCHDNLGEAPVRVGNAPKTLLLYVADKPFMRVASAAFIDPKSSETDRHGRPYRHRLEVLADGQQFVAYHTHPETGKPYVWTHAYDWEDPINIPSIDLAPIAEKHAVAACKEFERHCKELGWREVQAGSYPMDKSGWDDGDAMAEIDPPEETDAEVARVRSALEVIKTVISEYDYDQWRNVLFAIKWTRWDCAEALAREVSEASDLHHGKTFNTVWRGAQKRERGREVTLGSLFNMAKAAGWDAKREVTAEEKQANFETLLAEAAALKDAEKALPAVQKLIEKMASATLTGFAEGSILKEIKKHTGYSIVDMRRDLMKARKAHVKEVDHMATHAGYAAKLIEKLEESASVKPVGVEGMIYTYSPKKGVWQGKLAPDYAAKVADLFDGQENCSRRNDYLAISQHAYSVISDGNEKFFSDAPVGLACSGRFYRINKEGEIEREEIDHTHRQRVLSPVKPVVGQMPMFERFLEDTFKGDTDTEQVDLLQEVMGAIMLGMLAKFEKVALLKGPGRSGKGTIMKIITAMLPDEVCAAVSPFKWDSEYYLANLAGKRLNVVGELPDDEPIPASHFKSVTGRDTLTGRHPSHRPFVFRNEAAHVFNSNHFVYTKDHTEAFYTRWILMEFRNSRIGRESEQVVDLADRIIENELSAVMAWALKGARRLQDRGYFKTTKVQLKLMAEWRHRTNTLVEFLLDGEFCKLGDGKQFVTRRSEFYKTYSEWCKTSNRRPMGKMKLYDELQNDSVLQLGITQGKGHAGHDVVRGLRLVGDSWAEDLEDETDDL